MMAQLRKRLCRGDPFRALCSAAAVLRVGQGPGLEDAEVGRGIKLSSVARSAKAPHGCRVHADQGSKSDVSPNCQNASPSFARGRRVCNASGSNPERSLAFGVLTQLSLLHHCLFINAPRRRSPPHFR